METCGRLAGASIPPETMMHFPPVSDSPYFQKNFRLWGKFSQFSFSRKISCFSSNEISDDLFFSHRPQISNFPLIFAVSVHFPLFRDKTPTLTNFPPLFYTNSPALYILYVYFVSPYFYHDAFMHHPMHVLDATELVPWCAELLSSALQILRLRLRFNISHRVIVFEA